MAEHGHHPVLVHVGRGQFVSARAHFVFEFIGVGLLDLLSPLGLLAEDFDASRRVLCGNFPQAYSHVGLIHAAFAASPPWSEVL